MALASLNGVRIVVMLEVSVVSGTSVALIRLVLLFSSMTLVTVTAISLETSVMLLMTCW